MNTEKNHIPRHIAIIMDGNGRWAVERGQDRTYGHQAGVDTVRRITSECVRLGVEYLTLYTFSTENWNRPADEVATLMGLVLTALEDEIFMKNNVRFPVQKKLQDTMEHTAGNTAMTMIVALSYSARWEITKAAKEIARKAVQEYIQAPTLGQQYLDGITEQTVSDEMETYFMPDPDLLIRTGGELRISNYLLWQIAYTELYFTETYWPDFDENELHKAIESYQNRQRRYGKTGQQVENENNIR